MFNLYYAGKRSLPEFEAVTGETTEWGHKMFSVRLGSRSMARNGVALPTAKTIEDTHTFVGTTCLGDLEEVFEAYQGMFVSQEFSDFIKESDATHTSMSVGDVAWNVSTGEMLLCDGMGWTLLETEGGK
jgi:hypothetical protein